MPWFLCEVYTTIRNKCKLIHIILYFPSSQREIRLRIYLSLEFMELFGNNDAFSVQFSTEHFIETAKWPKCPAIFCYRYSAPVDNQIRAFFH